MRFPFLLALLMLGLCEAVVWAQPPAAATVNEGKPKPFDFELETIKRMANETPEGMVIAAITSFGWGDLKTAAFAVAGSDPHSPELARLQEALSLKENRVRWNATNDPEKTAVIPEGATEITVRVRAGVSDGLALERWQDEEVKLRLETVRGQKIWRVAPENPELIFTTTFEQSPDVGIARRIATYLAYPKQAVQWLGLSISQPQARQIGLSIIQLVMNRGEKFPFDADNFKEQIRPHLPNPALLTAPGDAPGKQSFGFNPYLSGKKLADIQDTANTVMVYLGDDEKLDFRYNGKTIIAFVDGHTEAVDAERAKTLRWKP